NRQYTTRTIRHGHHISLSDPPPTKTASRFPAIRVTTTIRPRRGPLGRSLFQAARDSLIPRGDPPLATNPGRRVPHCQRALLRYLVRWFRRGASRGRGLPLVAWTHRLKEVGDGGNTQEVRQGLQGRRGRAGPGDWQADRAGGPGPGHQRRHAGELGERG